MPRADHDSLFKQTFGTPRHAAAELRALLPTAIAAAIDWATLRVEKGSFVDEALSARHSDLLYSVHIRGRAALLYLLFEHQSTSDPLMAYRLLRYIVRIWDRWLTHDPSSTSLPAVVPMVLP